jgi:anti-sigma-K factor RskA
VDIQQYISSGIIEAYVLGMASDEEARELELLSAQYPEIMEALSSSQEDMENYANLLAIEPPSGMKEQIWATLETETNPAFIAEQPLQAATTSNVRQLDSRDRNSAGSGFRRMMAVAAVLVILFSVGANLVLWNRAQSTGQEMASLKSDQQKMLASNQAYQQQLEQYNHNMKMMLNPDMKSMVLAGIGNHAGTNAMLLWDTKSKEVYLSLKDMPPPPSGKQYQLWAIVDGKPVDAGVYALNSKDAMQRMSVIPNAQMFAITIEKAGGSPTPTMDQMVVAGKV